VKQNFTLGGLYDLPVGKGKKFGNNMNKLTDLVIGGWNVNYFFNVRTGFPITVLATDRTGQAARGNVRANHYGTLTKNDSLVNIDNFFGLPTDPANSAVRGAVFCAAGVNNCAYGQPSDGFFGNSGIGTERGPSYFNMDYSIGKKFNVTERQYIDFRMEAFNGLNHVSWGAPGRSVAAPASFGVVGSQVQQPRNIQFGLKYYF
jgi:hypothetical protein